MLKDEFRQLKFVLFHREDVCDVNTIYGPCLAGMIPMLQDIYRSHGWPDLEIYNKDDCLSVVQNALEEHYPDQAWRSSIKPFESRVQERERGTRSVGHSAADTRQGRSSGTLVELIVLCALQDWIWLIVLSQ